MKIAIVGFGLEGCAAYEYWREGHEITICDQNPNTALPEAVQTQLGADYLKGLGGFDLIVRSPHTHPQLLVAANSPAILEKITSVTNEFLKVSPSKNIIGVTGTKGKGTTSTLISKMLEAAGQRVHLGGNIGIPALDLLKNNIQPSDWVVLELSSFQLIDLKSSPRIGVCLMVVSEHLDWHQDINEYAQAKQQLFARQTENDVAIYYAKNELSQQIAAASKGRKVPYFTPPGAYVDQDRILINDQEICKVNELRLLGSHNWQNICAAVTTVWQITQDLQAIREVLLSFTGLEHRLEFVREFEAVKYYDDSFGTTPETAIVALQAFSEPKVFILGGSDKGATYDGLAEEVAHNNIRKVLLIGEQAARIEEALKRAGFNNFMDGGRNMSEVIATARQVASPGDVVLLSPACASFNMFTDYKDRGNQFKAAVQALF